ncbi:hypothetical protein F3157_07905 [Virgibacillus dakarensis]|nr:hypothetical protein [Virgibacillus dakarensis]
MRKERSQINIIEIDNSKTVKIPVYSSIKLIDGKLVGEIEGYEEFPAELVQDNEMNH